MHGQETLVLWLIDRFGKLLIVLPNNFLVLAFPLGIIKIKRDIVFAASLYL